MLQNFLQKVLFTDGILRLQRTQTIFKSTSFITYVIFIVVYT